MVVSLVAVSVVVYGTPTGSAAGPPSAAAFGTSWNLAKEFRTAPAESNPNPGPRGHNRPTWYFMQGSGHSEPSTFTLLRHFVPDAFNIRGLQQWQGSYVSTGPTDKLPAVGLNATGSTQHPPCCRGLSWPANVIRIHPLAHLDVIVGWRSPVSGRVCVSATFSDLDPGGGNGIRWFVDRGAQNLVRGRLFNGGPPQSDHLCVRVAPLSFLYFIVGPGPDHDYG
jgi:hypothetical protein